MLRRRDAGLAKELASGDPERVGRAAVGYGAWLEARGEITEARTAYRGAIDTGHHPYDIDAARLLALMGSRYEYRDDDELWAEVDAAFRLVLDSGDERYARECFGVYGICQGVRGDLVGARATFHRFLDEADRADPKQRAADAIDLAGILSSGLDDLEGARELLLRALESPNPDDVAKAHRELDLIDQSGGDLEAWARLVEQTGD